MKNLLILLILFLGCKIFKPNLSVEKIAADSLIANIDKFVDKKVEIEGIIVHICGVDGKKMKLKTDNGAIIKIIPQDSFVHFDKSFYQKRVKILGKVKESRIEKSYIDSVEQKKTLLCHIDNSPCKDSVWVNNQIKNKKADTLSKRDVEKLRKKLKKRQKLYFGHNSCGGEMVFVLKKFGFFEKLFTFFWKIKSKSLFLRKFILCELSIRFMTPLSNT